MRAKLYNCCLAYDQAIKYSAIARWFTVIPLRSTITGIKAKYPIFWAILGVRLTSERCKIISSMNSNVSFYNQKVGTYTIFAKFVDFFGMARLRRRLLKNVRGKILEVAAGSGQNLQYYPAGADLMLADLSRPMLQIAEQRAKDQGLDVTTQLMDTEQLAFPDNTFDTVVSTLSVCSYDNPIKALQEMARVCKSKGTIFLLEHGKSSYGTIAAYQAWRETWKRKPHCHLTRNYIELCSQAGLNVTQSRRSFYGIVFTVMAQKA